MRTRTLWIVYRKELRDLLRDRRTIIAMIVIPLLVMPLLMVSISAMATRVVGQARQAKPKIMIVGGEDSTNTADALRALDTVRVVPYRPDFTNEISDRRIGAAVEIPPGFDAAVAAGKRRTIHIYTYEGEIKSVFAAETVETFLHHRREAEVRDRLAAHGLKETVLTPFTTERANVVSARKVTGNITGIILPYLIIFMCMSGALYPAVDLTAGEKERGTMETLLCSPVGRTQLVIGKVLVVLTAAVASALFSLCSNGVAVVLLSHSAASSARALHLSLDFDLTTLLSVAAIVIPLALFIAASLVSVGLFARTSKEANSYLQPMLLVAIVPAVASGLPGMEMNYRFALIPVFNVGLTIKELLVGIVHWNYLAVVFGSMCLYAALAVWVAVQLFKRESVLFRT